MSFILGIESDATRRTLLETLIREHVRADVTITASAAAAIEVIDRSVPDVIVAPALMSPSDGAALIAHLKERAAPFVQVVTIPAFDMLSAPATEEKRSFGVFRRRASGAPVLYDRAMVGSQIADAVVRAREARIDYAARLAEQAEREELARMQRLRPAVELALAPLGGSAADRRAALRLAQREIPWLSNVRLSLESPISLVNISSSGVLLESGSKFVPGSSTELHLTGPEGNLVVPVRFIRSEIARIDGLGVKYHAAAAFAREIDLASPRAAAAPRPASPPHVLADLFSSALSDTSSPDPSHVRFARGLCDLVGAREVQIRNGAGASGRETLYFDVPASDRGRTTLQITFARGRDVSPQEFALLQAAAWMTAAALELEKSAAVSAALAPRALLEEQVA
jgi:CheY-like chemotaxis protein